MVERPTLRKWDFHSLLCRKDAIFLDIFLLLALLKLAPSLWRSPKIDNWTVFSDNCQTVDFVGLANIPSDDLKSLAYSLINKLSRKVVVQVEACKMLLKKIKPSVIFETTSYDSTPRAVCLVARRSGIPVVELQHGLISRSHIGYIYYLPQNFNGELLLPSKILVYGDEFKRLIIEASNAFTSDMISVTGSPRMSRFMKRLEHEGRDNIKKKTRHRLGIEKEQCVVTVTTQPTTRSSLNVFLGHALKELEGMDILLCLKPHPSELDTWRSGYVNLLNDSRVTVVLDKDVDLYELLIASDLHITVNSTVFLECFSLGVPNIIAKCPGYELVFDVVSNGEILVAETPADFAMLVRKFVESPWYRHQIIWQGKQIGARYFAINGDPESNILSHIQGVVC